MQLNLFEARALRDAAISQIAESSGPQWQQTAFACLEAFIASNDAPFMIEDVRLANPDLPAPHDNRAWGAVARRAIKHGLIQRVGFAPAKTSHCSAKPLWQKVGA